MASILFGTDGWRATAPDPFSDRNVARVAQAFAEWLLAGPNARRGVAVGYDGRANGRAYATRVARVLSGNGIKVYLSDAVCPTPAVSFVTARWGLAAGIMVTASHNPPSYNGLKFKSAAGGPFTSEMTAAVEAALERIGEPKDSTDQIRLISLRTAYVNGLMTLIDAEAIGRRRLKLVHDAMHGAGERLLVDILGPLGTHITPVATEPLADFGGRLPEPIEQNLAPLMETVRRIPSCDVGLATDGDADRLGAVQGDGTYLSAQWLYLLLAYHQLHHRRMPGDLVKTLSVTDKANRLAARYRRKVTEVPVGFKWIGEIMAARPIAFGGEESGGFGFGGHLPERDGVLAGLMLTELLAVSGKSITELVAELEAEFGPLHYDRVDVPYDRPDRGDLLPALVAALPTEVAGLPVASHELFTTRGIVSGLKLRFDGDERWLLIRASATEPLVRVYAEGHSDDEVVALLRDGQRALFGEVLLKPAT